MDAGMRELLAAVRQQSEHRAGYSNIVGSLGLAPMGMAGVAKVSVTTDTATVAVVDDSPTDVGMPLNAKTVFLAIMWVFAILLPLKIGLLSPDVQTIVRDYLMTVGTALIIHWRVPDKPEALMSRAALRRADSDRRAGRRRIRQSHPELKTEPYSQQEQRADHEHEHAEPRRARPSLQRIPDHFGPVLGHWFRRRLRDLPCDGLTLAAVVRGHGAFLHAEEGTALPRPLGTPVPAKCR